MAQSFEQKSVFVALSNLPPSASKQAIQRLLDCEAAVFKMGNLHTDETSLQYCEVELFNQRDVRNVLTLNGKIFMGYEIEVKKLVAQENPLEVFVRKVSAQATEIGIACLFGQFGEIEDVTLPRWHDSGKPRGFAFIRFAEENSAKAAVQCDGQLKFYGIRLSIRPNRRVPHQHRKPQAPKEQVSKRMSERPQGCRTIYVGNVDFDASEPQISELFSKCGIVLNVRVVRQQFTNRSRGFAYIEFADEESVTKAVGMNGQEFLGRDIRVDYAEPFDPTRSQTRNFSTFNPPVDSSENEKNEQASTNYLDNYLPTPSSFIADHFMDNPWAGMAALAGCMNEQQLQLQRTLQLAQYQQHLVQMAGGQQFVAPFLPNCSMPMFAPMSVPQVTPIGHMPNMPTMPQMPNFFNQGRATPTMNFTHGGEPAQFDRTLFTQGIPGVGQFIAPYAMLTQRPVPVTNVSKAQTIQAKPPANAPVASTEQQTNYGSSMLKSRFLQLSFSPQDLSSARHTETNMSTVSSPPGTIASESVSSPYVISDSIEAEPWESREVNNAILY